MISLDKNLCNLLLKQNRLPIPESYCIESINKLSNYSLKNYPYFVKPSCEGSGIGINIDSIVYSKEDLEKQADFVIRKYRQSALIQRYLPNEDITIGVLETDNQVISLTPLIGKLGIFMDPISSNNSLFHEVKNIAEDVFKIVKCRDIARIDLKLSELNDVYFLEINPLPLLTKSKGYFMESANFSGFSYNEVLKFTIQNTKKRFAIE
jgi:D-alanine-D-alanine ligase